MEELPKKRVKIFINNGFKYEGFILSHSENFIVLKDIGGKEVTISKGAVTTIEPQEEELK